MARLFCLLVLLCSSPALAGAQDAPALEVTPAAEPDTGALASGAAADMDAMGASLDDEAARAHFEAARSLYAAGSFALAAIVRWT